MFRTPPLLPSLPTGPTFRLVPAPCLATPDYSRAVDLQLLPGETGDLLDMEIDSYEAIKAAYRDMGHPIGSICRHEYAGGTTFYVIYLGAYRVWVRASESFAAAA